LDLGVERIARLVGDAVLEVRMILAKRRFSRPATSTSDQWRDEEIAHTPACSKSSAAPTSQSCPEPLFPWCARARKTQLWQERYGKVAYAGAWDDRWWHEPFAVPPLAEGPPAIKAADEDAAHFLVRMVHKYPHQVTI
jgi:purine nucleosidase